ncbi:hypothetical protein [Nocardia sp. NPDC051463]|uniref:hypothetical protein n=1 Tax=Nocardia sp. NPDC051463 TaxID=3154845 RepID=UPI00344B596A
MNATQPRGLPLKGRDVADLADLVLPALTASMQIVHTTAPEEIDNFRRTIAPPSMPLNSRTAVGRGVAGRELARKIAVALDRAAPRPPAPGTNTCRWVGSY